MPSNFLYAVSLINVVVSIIIALFIFLYNPKSRLHVWITISIIICALWAGSLTAGSFFNNVTLARMVFSFGALTCPAVTVFLLVFSKKDVSGLKIFLIFLAPLIISALCPLEGMLYKEMSVVNGNLIIGTNGPLLPFFNLSFFTFFVVMITLMVRASKILTGVEKTQLKYLIVGLGIFLFSSSVLNMVLAILGNNDYGKFGPLGIIFFTLPLIYVATKHHLSDTRVVFSEIWAFGLVFVTMVGLVINRDIYSFVLFAVSAGLSMLLVRAVNSEYEKSKKLEIQNQELISDKAKLNTLDKMKDEFIQMATHELNTPIAIIEGKLSMIVDEKMGPFNDEQRTELKSISDAARRLAKLLKNLFEIAEIQQKMIWLFRRDTDINHLIADEAAKYQEKAQAKGIQLSVKQGQGVPKLSIDKDKIADAVGQLIDNAVKFTSQGQIIVETSATEGGVGISVTDTGAGISKTDLEHIFDKFFQAGRFEPGNPHEQQGSGSSLYIIKSVVELHGGRVLVVSEPHKGSKFTILLPLQATEGSFESSGSPLETVKSVTGVPEEPKEQAPSSSAQVKTSKAKKSVSKA